MSRTQIKTSPFWLAISSVFKEFDLQHICDAYRPDGFCQILICRPLHDKDRVITSVQTHLFQWLLAGRCAGLHSAWHKKSCVYRIVLMDSTLLPPMLFYTLTVFSLPAVLYVAVLIFWCVKSYTRGRNSHKPLRFTVFLSFVICNI